MSEDSCYRYIYGNPGYSATDESAAISLNSGKATPKELKESVLHFIHKSCKGLRFDLKKEKSEKETGTFLGKSLKAGDVPYNQQMEVDRLCLENSMAHFLDSGLEPDALNVYVCMADMFPKPGKTTYERLKNVLENREDMAYTVNGWARLLSAFERDAKIREAYCRENGIELEDGACHFLENWGEAALFDELPPNENFSANENKNVLLHIYELASMLNFSWLFRDGDISDEKNIIYSLEEFEKLSLEYKLFNINQVKSFLKEPNIDLTDDLADKVGIAEHYRWLKDHEEMGWRNPAFALDDEAVRNALETGSFDRKLRELKRLHPCMPPAGIMGTKQLIDEKIAEENYNMNLSRGEKDKDILPIRLLMKLSSTMEDIDIYKCRKTES